MPHSGPAVDGQINSIEPSPGVDGETLIFSPDLMKTDSFHPNDHVILVVPDSSDNLVANGEEADGAQYITIPNAGSPVQDDSATITVDPSQFADPLKPNFLFITKLVHPSKLPMGLIPIAAKTEPTTDATVVISNNDKSSIIVDQMVAHQTGTSTAEKSQKQPKPPKNLGKCQGSKQEAPEIFGKLFPASFNEVLFKKIREIVLLKNGPDTTDDTDVLDGIVCPHCRKQQRKLNCLREHLYNCHTYVNKRKLFNPVRNRPKRPLHRCTDCNALFISSERMENHDCRRPNQISIESICRNKNEKTVFARDHDESAKLSNIRSSSDDMKVEKEFINLSRKLDCLPNSATGIRPDTASTPTTIVEETSPHKCLGCRAVLTNNFQICEKCLTNAEIKGDTIILECEFDASEIEDGSVVRVVTCTLCKCSFDSTSVSQTLCDKCSTDS